MMRMNEETRAERVDCVESEHVHVLNVHVKHVHAQHRDRAQRPRAKALQQRVGRSTNCRDVMHVGDRGNLHRAIGSPTSGDLRGVKYR